MRTKEIVKLYDRYVIGNYTRRPVAIVRGKGSWVWDADGKRYLDLFPGWGVDGIGHCHPRVIAAVTAQLKKLLHVDNTLYMEPQARLAQIIAEKGFGGQSFFCNSGTEAVEAAIKLARLRYAPHHRHTIITMRNSFHGRTFGSLSATGQAKFHKGVGPLLPGFKHVPFNDLRGLEKAVDRKTCAVMLEPVQGEAGVHIARKEYLRGVRKLCDRKGLLLILDEVQTAPGRTGKWFAHQHYGITPDIMAMSKMLGGGIAIGCICARPDVAKSLVPGTHAATFGGNPIACAAAIATFHAIEEEHLLQNAVRAEKRIRRHLKRFQRKYPFVKDVRVIGCMAAMELTRPAGPIRQRCLDSGLLINCTHETILRMLPAMTISAAEIDEAMAILEKALEQED
jgi:predicted acetylornithine/succinylornithine family transaminase